MGFNGIYRIKLCGDPDNVTSSLSNLYELLFKFLSEPKYLSDNLFIYLLDTKKGSVIEIYGETPEDIRKLILFKIEEFAKEHFDLRLIYLYVIEENLANSKRIGAFRVENGEIKEQLIRKITCGDDYSGYNTNDKQELLDQEDEVIIQKFADGSNPLVNVFFVKGFM